METKAKSNSVITTEISSDLMHITFKVKDAGELTLSLSKLNSAILDRARVHGLIQRISDAAAISRTAENGYHVSPQAKLDAMRALVEHYESGTSEWNRKRAEGAGAGYSNGLLAQVLKMAYPEKSAERIAEYIKGLKASERVALLASETLKDYVEAVRAEAAKAIKVDADALLSGL